MYRHIQTTKLTYQVLIQVDPVRVMLAILWGNDES